MHERSVAKNLLKIVLDKVDNTGEQNEIKSIRILVGEFTMVQEDLLVSAFYDLSRSTIAENAKIIVTRKPLTGKCSNCKKEFPLNKREFLCPYCKSNMIQIISGDELFVQDIELN